MTEKVRFGPANPHPLSQLKTELVWEGKYDDYGNRRVVDIAGCAMPMQKIETIDEPRSRAAAEGQIELFEKTRTRIREESGQYAKTTNGPNGDFRNRLIWGDNKPVIASLLSEFKGRVDLIYIDPPFDVGADFTMDVPLGDGSDSVFKDQSVLEMVAFKDMWGKHTDSYLHMMYERLTLMRALLSEKGSIFIHVGPEIAPYVRACASDCFGQDNFRNEIILPGRATKNLQQQFDTISRLQIRHDVLLWFSNRAATRFEPFWITKHKAGNPEGHWHHFWSTADRPTMRYELFGVTPQSGQWVWRQERAMKAVENYQRFLTEAGGRTLAEYWRDTGSSLEFVRPSPDDGKPQYWREPAELRLADTMWSGVPIYSAEHDYPTEKNEKFLTEVLRLGSSEGDLVGDFFCGSGTTGAVARAVGSTLDHGRFRPLCDSHESQTAN
jgi:adenine-specific DNA-methyltransferase